jgi:hypothetical protein
MRHFYGGQVCQHVFEIAKFDRQGGIQLHGTPLLAARFFGCYVEDLHCLFSFKPHQFCTFSLIVLLCHCCRRDLLKFNVHFFAAATAMSCF